MAESLPLVLLHGWGFDSRIWEPVLPLFCKTGACEKMEVIALDLPGFGSAEPDEDVLSRLPPRCILLGWSLGGLVATQIAMQHPERVAGLITIGSNLKWVATDGWPGAPADNFAAFFENLAQNFEATKQHFCGVIARGDINEKQQVRFLREKLSNVPVEHFLQGLQLLDSIDNRAGFPALSVPGLHLFGEKDAMVPLAVEQQMKRLNNKQQTIVIPGTAHAPFLSEPQLFAKTVTEWINKLPYQLDKKRVAASFSKAATTYDSAAHLQRSIGDKLLSYLPLEPVASIVDVGCGTGLFTSQLKLENPSSQVIALDLAGGMLNVLKSRDSSVQPVCGDAENLPLADGSINLLFSNLVIQWCQDYPRLFAEWHRVLAADGVCVVSTFVDGTLQELADAWRTVDDRVHINHFVPARTLCQFASEQGFNDVECYEQTEILRYRTLRALMRELKHLGAHNLNAGRHSGLTGKRLWVKLVQAYETRREHEMLPATWRVAYLVLKK